jgi:hypothetical protein
MAFELWSGLSGNLLSRHATEAEALMAVLEVAAANDPAYVAQLGLLQDTGRSTELIAQGTDLVQRARHATVDAASPPSSRKQRASR